MTVESMVNLDVRETIRQGNDPFVQIMRAVGGLQPGQKLSITAPFLPTPLLHVMRQKGFRHQADPIGQTGDWRVVFEADANPAEPPALSCPPAKPGPEPHDATLAVDTRGLEPPEPMIKILEALGTLPPGARLEARTDRRPMHLYAHLEERGFVGHSTEQLDGTYLTLIHAA